MALTLPPSGSQRPIQALAADGRSLNALKLEAGQANTPETARAAAKQLESLFMRELIKSMREATVKSGLLDSSQGDLAQDMFDQQLSVQMAGQPGGLSEAIMRQLSRQMGGGDVSLSTPTTLSFSQATQRTPAAVTSTRNPNATVPSPKGRDDFVQHHSEAAEKVARESGIPASFMLGQAGHETGWGKGEIRNANGTPAFNLFGIKATKGWTGKVAEVTTTEYIDGVPRKMVARFRAYDSYEDSFRDYARLINTSPRYEKAREKTGSAMAYAAELQKAGYATDPEYAKKLSGAIKSVLRVQA